MVAMKKKLLILALITMLVSNICVMNSQAVTENEAYAGSQLSTLGILKGYPDGTLRLDNNIIRSEVAALTVRILGYEDTIILGTNKAFTDLGTAHWAYDDIQNAYKLGLIIGYPDVTFKPDNNISYAEVVTIMVNALGENTDLEGNWPENYLTKAKAIGVIPEDSAVDPDKIVTRGEMAVIIWDTLLVKK
jgi:hypothetical protein